ncbi:MAG: glycerate kinase [Leptospiraceae bacterium]|nr:MAG: glycerate kinase [Leptospiraceae bacterium]
MKQNLLKENIERLIQKTIQKIQPDHLLLEKLNQIYFLEILNKIKYYSVISLGKAGFSMGNCFYHYVKKHNLIHKLIKGFIVTPYFTKKHDIEKFEIIESSHPYPDHNSLYAGDRLFELIKEIPEDCTIILLLSGGASALIEKPITNLNLNDIQKITEQLLKSGASIQEINTIRKKLSLIKGGGLGEILYPRPVYQFVLCDVIGKNAIEYVSSGPMYPDTTKDEELWSLIKKYNINIKQNLKFPLKKRSSLKDSYIIGNNEIACKKLQDVLNEHYKTKIKIYNFSGNIEDYEELISNDIKHIINNSSISIAYIWGGEPTIKIKGNGKGGRNQELCLRIAFYLDKLKNINKNLYFCSFGTDGIDGPTDACGGIVCQNSISKINKILLSKSLNYKNPKEILNNNDSYFALNLIDSLIKIGPTGTNLNDLSFFIYE